MMSAARSGFGRSPFSATKPMTAGFTAGGFLEDSISSAVGGEAQGVFLVPAVPGTGRNRIGRAIWAPYVHGCIDWMCAVWCRANPRFGRGRRLGLVNLVLGWGACRIRVRHHGTHLEPFQVFVTPLIVRGSGRDFAAGGGICAGGVAGFDRDFAGENFWSTAPPGTNVTLALTD